MARCTVARLMRQMGIKGAVRGKAIRTTVSDPSAPCPLDRVNRQFGAPQPNMLWVSDFTHVTTWAGFIYVAFVIDAFARRIVGWRVSRSARATLSWMRSSRRSTTGVPSRSATSRLPRRKPPTKFSLRQSRWPRRTQTNLPPGNPARFTA